MDSGNFVGMILLDIQKSCDTVDHVILISKFEAIGLGHDIMLWFKSYLCDRQQLVDVSSTHSSFSNTCGVPQGSIPGRLLFCIYMLITNSCCMQMILLFYSLPKIGYR